jgi:hypothetical protein
MSWRRSSRREWALAVAGGLGLAAVLLLALRPDAALPPAPPAPPTPAPIAPPPPVVSAAPPLPALELTGLRAGPDGGSATVRMATADGSRQVLLVPGRPLPGQPATGGWRLEGVEGNAAILAGPGGARQRLAFVESASSAGTPGGGPGGDATAWRIALTPRRGANGIEGWVLGDPAGVPALARAGLQRGDVLMEAGGIPLISEEKIIDLPQELAANGQLNLRYRRGDAIRSATLLP